MAQTGKAIMALRSTAKGNVSTIVLGLKGPTTTPKDNVDHVVTEWGATAKLRGLSDGARAYQMFTVAHPLFRGELAETAKKRGLITEGRVYALKASVFHAVRSSPLEGREVLANAALEKGLLSNDEHTELVVEAQEVSVPAQRAPGEANRYRLTPARLQIGATIIWVVVARERAPGTAHR